MPFLLRFTIVLRSSIGSFIKLLKEIDRNDKYYRGITVVE